MSQEQLPIEYLNRFVNVNGERKTGSLEYGGKRAKWFLFCKSINWHLSRLFPKVFNTWNIAY